MVNQQYYSYGTAPSVIRELFAYGLGQAALVGAENVYDYSLGNPSIPAPAKVGQTIEKLAQEMDPVQLHGYSMAGGFDDARQAVAQDMAVRFQMDIQAGDLFFTCGAAPALVSVLRALAMDENTEFLVVAPYFPEYKVFIESCGAKCKVVPADTKAFQIDEEALRDMVGTHTQAVILNSPNNPSGVVYTRETLERIGAILKAKEAEVGHPIYIIADEPYRELVYGGVEVPFLPAIYPDTIICYSWSKSLSLPGERIGYVCVPKVCQDGPAVYAAVAGAARAIGHVCPPTLIQRVIQYCAEERPDLEAYNENRELLYGALTKIGYTCAKPDGAFYLFVQAPGGDANAFSEQAKTEHNLLVVPGDGFGCPGYFRLSYCVDNGMIRRSLPAFQAMFEASR